MLVQKKFLYKPCFVVPLLVMLATSSSGQSLEWAHALNTNEFSQIKLVKAMPGGGTCVIGFFRGTLDLDPGPGSHVYVSDSQAGLIATENFVAAYGPAGEFLWGRHYSMHVAILDLDVLPTGDIIFCGRHTQSFSPDIAGGIPTTSNTGGFVIRLNSQGQFVNAHDLPSHEVSRVVAHPTDGYYIAGNFLNEIQFTIAGVPITHFSAGNFDVFLALIQQEEYVWIGTVGGIGLDKVADLDSRQEGVVLATVGGGFGIDADPGPDTLSVSFTGINGLVLSLVDHSGALQDAVVFDLQTSENSICSRFVEEGGLLLALSVAGTVNVSPTSDPFMITTNAVDGVLLRLDGSLDLVWVDHFTGELYNGIDNVAVHPAGQEVIITGRFLGEVDLDPGIGEVIHITDDPRFYMAAYCMDDGSLKWSFSSVGANGSSSGRGISFADNASFFIGGSGTAGMDLDPGEALVDPNYPVFQNAFLAKYDADILLCPDATVTFIDELSRLEQIVAYPNPATTEIVLWVPSSTGSLGGYLSLTDMYGRTLQDVLIVQEKTLVDLTDISSGMYLLSVINEGRLLRTFKIHKL